MTMYQPVPLPYSYSALEPFIDEKTMYVHFNEHYLGYIKKLNALLPSGVPIYKLISNIDNYSTDIRNNAGGYFNHSLFWNMLRPYKPFSTNEPPTLVRNIIDRDFGNFNNFKNQILETAKKRFGSGWIWWILNPDGTTEIVQTPYQDNPLMYKDCKILLGIDVWEHAYYLKYQAKREKYVNNIFNVINWNYPNRILIENN
jgi:Fe-Mn family superoxide dismutase